MSQHHYVSHLQLSSIATDYMNLWVSRTGDLHMKIELILLKLSSFSRQVFINNKFISETLHQFIHKD